jgi:uncharacterized Fe-S cluster-containing radical SAM superfamily protein
MKYECSICGKEVIGSNLYCNNCYTVWKESIFSKEPWVVYLRNLEINRRREKLPVFVYLGTNLDISQDGIIFRREDG